MSHKIAAASARPSSTERRRRRPIVAATTAAANTNGAPKAKACAISSGRTTSTTAAPPRSPTIAPCIHKHVYLLRLNVPHVFLHNTNRLAVIVHPIAPTWPTTQARIMPGSETHTVVIYDPHQFHLRQPTQLQDGFNINARARSCHALHLND